MWPLVNPASENLFLKTYSCLTTLMSLHLLDNFYGKSKQPVDSRTCWIIRIKFGKRLRDCFVKNLLCLGV